MPKTFKTYYLNFISPLHIGDHRPDSYEQSETFLRSDTLVAAIFATWAKMGHADWIPESGDPPFVLSSAFPYWEKSKEEKNHFFPRLKITPKVKEELEYDTHLVKALKKVQWLDQPYFERLLQLEATSSFGKENKHIQGGFLTETELPKGGFITKEVMNRVSIPRNQEDGEAKDAIPFYMERIRFNNGGLFFLAEGEHLDRLELALNLLQYEGFGTDRNVGNGFFEFSTGEITLDTPSNGNYGTNLGLYCPESKEILNTQLDDNSRFELIKRGGWITKPNYQTIEKNSIYMFTEGSVFYEKDSIVGRGGIDLKPDYPIDHPIFRCGKSIFLPVNL
jgi:CRISPR type III-A-associated RAMP protein Csm4